MRSGRVFVVAGIQKCWFARDVTFSLEGNKCRLVFVDYKLIHAGRDGVMRSVQWLKWEEDWQYVMWRAVSESQRGKRSVTCLSATLSTTNPTWTDPVSNSGLRGERPATNRLGHGTALFLGLLDVTAFRNHLFILGNLPTVIYGGLCSYKFDIFLLSGTACSVFIMNSFIFVLNMNHLVPYLFAGVHDR
jgi:hypothetical protein